MKRLTTIALVTTFLVATVAYARPRHRGGQGPDKALVKQALTQAGLSDQQIRRIEVLRNEAKREILDIRHELEKARLDMKQLMQTYDADQAAVFSQIDKVHAIKLKLKKARVAVRLKVRHEMTQEQWEKVRLLRAEKKAERRKMRRGKKRGGMGGGGMGWSK